MCEAAGGVGGGGAWSTMNLTGTLPGCQEIVTMVKKKKKEETNLLLLPAVVSDTL